MFTLLTRPARLVWLFVAFIVLSSPAAPAEDPSPYLKAITDTADQLCGTVAQSGEYNSLTVKGDVTAAINGLLKRLADLGISGAGDLTSTTYQGVLQQELVTALKDVRDCKFKVFNILQEKLLPSKNSNVGSPLLHVSPSVGDAHLRWENGEFSPRPEQGGDPFAITIKNLGDRNAVNLTIKFVLNLDMEELIEIAQKSELFSAKHIEGDAKWLTVPTRFGLLGNSATKINLMKEDVVRPDEIQAERGHNEIIVRYPSGIKNAISLWLLITSHSQGTTWRAKEKNNIPPADQTLIMKYLNDQLKERQRASILVLPDVAISILFQDSQQDTFSTTATIRSIYRYEFYDKWAQWTRDERSQKLQKGHLVNAWLVSHAIVPAPGDYSIGQIEGGKEEIQTWNVAKLGAEPTEEQLWFMRPFLRDQQRVLSGGEGVLSYEDENNPSEGWFNIYKTQGFFTPRTHSQ